MTVVVTVQYNEFDKESGKVAVRKVGVYKDIQSVAPFGDSFVALTQLKGDTQASLLIPCVRIFTLHIMETPDVPEPVAPVVYVPGFDTNPRTADEV